MIYQIKQTSQKGQVLLESTARRGGNAVIAEVSLQMPENRALQIVHAFHVCERIIAVADLSIDQMSGDETKKILRQLKTEAKTVLVNA